MKILFPNMAIAAIAGLLVLGAFPSGARPTESRREDLPFAGHSDALSRIAGHTSCIATPRPQGVTDYTLDIRGHDF